jgi:hypothetical protein
MSMNGASVMGRKLVVMYAQPSARNKNVDGKDMIEDGV